MNFSQRSLVFQTLVLFVITSMLLLFCIFIEKDIVASFIVYWFIITGAVVFFNFLLHIRSKWKEFLSVFIAMTLAVTITDRVCRYLFVPESTLKFKIIRSEDYHHTHPANKKMMWGFVEGKRIFVMTNEDGLRTRYSRQAFRKRRDRIMILGDSFVFGPGVVQPLTFPKAAEKKLRRTLKRNDIAVLNAGIISFSPFLSDLFFEKQLKYYDPTVVMLFLDATDIGDDIKYSKEYGKNGKFVGFNWKDDELYYHSGMFYLLDRWIRYPYDVLVPTIMPQLKYQYYRFIINIDGVVERNRYFIYRHPLEKTRPYFEATLSNINKVAAAVQQQGARFVLVITPRYHHWNPNECPNNWERDSYPLNAPYQYEYIKFFEDAKDRVKYPVLNLLPAFEEAGEFPLVFDSDPHWNEQGHALVARVIADYLLQHELVR